MCDSQWVDLDLHAVSLDEAFVEILDEEGCSARFTSDSKILSDLTQTHKVNALFVVYQHVVDAIWECLLQTHVGETTDI